MIDIIQLRKELEEMSNHRTTGSSSLESVMYITDCISKHAAILPEALDEIERLRGTLHLLADFNGMDYPGVPMDNVRRIAREALAPMIKPDEVAGISWRCPNHLEITMKTGAVYECDCENVAKAWTGIGNAMGVIVPDTPTWNKLKQLLEGDKK
jgi:hypothetical protein